MVPSVFIAKPFGQSSMERPKEHPHPGEPELSIVPDPTPDFGVDQPGNIFYGRLRSSMEV